ncbi:PRTRC system ThiF family protein [bacterium]|nr:MAG: PRTRC system ThiF family protein [bacterium]
MWSLARDFLGHHALQVAVVGVGGTGSELVSNLIHLHLGLQALGFGGLDVTAFDPDTVSPANIVRQRYTRSDLGRNKAEVLIHRINLGCSLAWSAVPKRFTATPAKQNWDLVISCVDSRAARAQLHSFAFGRGFYRWKLWLDTGNSLTTGQVVLGTPRHPDQALVHALPCATELHPELMDTTIAEDDAPSCSAIEALRRQDLMVNKMVATLATDLLWRLFRDGQIECHARYFDLATSSLAALPAPTKPKRTRRAAT